MWVELTKKATHHAGSNPVITTNAVQVGSVVEIMVNASSGSIPEAKVEVEGNMAAGKDLQNGVIAQAGRAHLLQG